jgi:exopolysaccharide biosynthesis polyprenyl glycosylphosphotransferase
MIQEGVLPRTISKRLSLSPSERKVLLAFGDIVLLLVALVMSFWMWAVIRGHTFDVEFMSEKSFLFFLPCVWFFLAAIGGVYHQEVIGSFQKSLNTLLRCGISMVTMYIVLYFLLPPFSLPRGILIYHTGTSFFFLLGWRHLFLALSNSHLFRCRCIIVGHEEEIQEIESFLTKYSFFTIVGCLYTNGTTKPILFKENGDKETSTSPYEVDKIILAEKADPNPETREILLSWRERGIGITPFPLLYENLTGRIPVSYIGERWWPYIPLNGEQDRRIYAFSKRVLDVVGGILGLVGFSLLLPFIALAIKFDSPGPIFYRQIRVGRSGKTFQVWKVRTMFLGAEEKEGIWSNHNDHRATRVGRWLRKMRLDEFPQCWNVIKGEMSIVGPRPERIKVVERLEEELPFYRIRHNIKPGMAGWAMLNRGYMCSFDDAKARLEYDLYYLKYQSFWFDALIFLRACSQLLLMKGR